MNEETLRESIAANINIEALKKIAEEFDVSYDLISEYISFAMKKPNKSTYVTVKFTSGDYKIAYYDYNDESIELSGISSSWEYFLTMKDKPLEIKTFNAEALHEILKERDKD